MYQNVFISKIKVRFRCRINMCYALVYTSLCLNRSTCLNTYYELGYFQLITCETSLHECEKLINLVIANQPILTQTWLY